MPLSAPEAEEERAVNPILTALTGLLSLALLLAPLLFDRFRTLPEAPP